MTEMNIIKDQISKVRSKYTGVDERVNVMNIQLKELEFKMVC